MDGTRVERKGREKVVACRRVERTAIVAVVAIGSKIFREGEATLKGKQVAGVSTL